MKLSVVVPVYNTKACLKNCLQSIMEQTWRDMEIIIVDDGSTDGSSEICQMFAQKDDRVIYIKQNNKGSFNARRTGVERASGEFLMFVDSDDWIEKEMAEFLILRIKGADMVTSGVYYEARPGVVTLYLDQYEEGEYQDEGRQFLLKSMLYDIDTDTMQRLTPWIWNKLYRTKLAKQVYEQLETNNAFADDGVFLYSYLIYCGAVKVFHQCFYHYQYRENSIFHGKNSHMLTDINKAYLALLPCFEKHMLKEHLIQQLQRWITITTVMAINGGMGFSQQIQIPEFMLDTDGLKGKRVVLYGAGKVGKDYYRQLKKMGYNVVLWVDSNETEDENVKRPQEILHTEHDIILIAVSRPEYVESIQKSLRDLGVSEEKTLWKQPVRVL